MDKKAFLQRKSRVRAKVFGTKDRPRLSVYRSARAIYAQIINDEKRETLISVSDRSLAGKKQTKTEKAGLVGEMLAKKAVIKKIKKIVFDKGGYKYHGRVKALAEGARKGGLEF
jgi:large subunit ribosomal protein L18